VNKLLFLQKNLSTLQRINEEKSKQKQEQLKRRLSASDDEPILVIQDGSNVISTKTTKIMKTNDGCDYFSEDIENIIDDSAELSQLSIDL